MITKSVRITPNTDYLPSLGGNIMYLLLSSPMFVFSFFIGLGEFPLYYFFVPIFLNLALLKLIINNSPQNELRKDIKEKKIKPYLTLEYDNEEWKDYISLLIKKTNKSFLLTLKILCVLAILFSTLIFIKKQVFLIMILILINALSLVIFFYITQRRTPLMNALKSSNHKIKFYYYANIIDSCQYIIDFHTGFGGLINSISLMEINQKQVIEFSQTVTLPAEASDSGDSNVVRGKMIIPLPKKEYSNLEEIREIIDHAHYKIIYNNFKEKD